jgi:glycosyltransferase involved in cell wall biosynthesis
MAGSIAFILKGYPRLSETFIAQEILGLEHAGLDLVIVSLRRPTDPARHPIHNEIRAPVLYLPEYLHEEPIRVWRGFWSALRSGFLARVLGVFWHDLRRDPTRNRLRRLGQACVLARELPTAVDRLYVHYLHTPASVARYTARMRNLPFAISAHAKDIWTIPDWEIREKLADAAWLTTCTSLGFRHLRNLAPNARLICLPHGIDLARLPASSACAAAGTETPSPPIELVTVARAVEKKGLDILLEALSMLPPDIDWRWRHIGGGPLLPKLRGAAERLGIAGRVSWLGALAFDDVLAALRRADLFCFASRVAADGDRDGIPNVVAEAMSQCLPVVAARAGAVDELVEDGRTGILVPPDDPGALATAIAGLIRDPERRRAMGRAGRSVIETSFTAGPGIARIARELAGLAHRPATH